jgi:hypothetical protein
VLEEGGIQNHTFTHIVHRYRYRDVVISIHLNFWEYDKESYMMYAIGTASTSISIVPGQIKFSSMKQHYNRIYVNCRFVDDDKMIKK